MVNDNIIYLSAWGCIGLYWDVSEYIEVFGNGNGRSVGRYQYIWIDKGVGFCCGMYRGVLSYLKVGVLGFMLGCQIILRSLNE